MSVNDCCSCSNTSKKILVIFSIISVKSFEQSSETQFTLKFYVEGGGGLKKDKRLDKGTYTASLGFNEYSETFDTSDPKQLHKAIQTLLYYTFSMPDVFGLVFNGTSNTLFLAMDKFGAYDLKYISASSYSTITYTVDPGINKDDYKTFMEKMGKIPDEKMLFFLGFHNGGNPRKVDANKRMLRYIWDKFAEIFVRNGITTEYIGLYDFTKDDYLS